MYGFGAALLGGFLYWAFVKITNFELGLMAIAVGWLVGKAIMKGSNERGGRRYQVLALALTYFSITISYGALIIGEVMKNPPKDNPPTITATPQTQQQQQPAVPSQTSTPAVQAPAQSPQVVKPTAPAEPEMTAGTAVLGLGFLFLILLASPFLAGFSNVIGWLIIAIGLYEAWKHTREVPFLTGGPYQIAVPEPATPPALPEPAEEQDPAGQE